MPIVDVEIVRRPGETIRKDLVHDLANELGDIFRSPQGGTWVKVRGLPAEHYAENGEMLQGVYPVFLTIIKSEVPSSDALQKEVEKITGAVAQICGRSSENVHVIYQTQGKGRLAFGGKILP